MPSSLFVISGCGALWINECFFSSSYLGHPWLAGHHDVKIPLDTIVYKLVKAYICSSSLRKTALKVCNQKSCQI